MAIQSSCARVRVAASAVPGWENELVRTYREHCPIARASEILAERWTPLVVRNLLYGCTTFSEIARGVPTMSRSLLIKRLKELERAGVVRKRAAGSPAGYELTDAGADLAGVIDALGGWGERWIEVTTEHSDPGFVLWSWVKYYLDSEALPAGRSLVEFTFPDEVPTNRRYWLLVSDQQGELCYSHPGGDPDLYITAASDAFTQWHVGKLPWWTAVGDGTIRVAGSTRLARQRPRWNRHPDLRN